MKNMKNYSGCRFEFKNIKLGAKKITKKKIEAWEHSLNDGSEILI